ncbi:uncharacterized protein HKW66_Vig0232870 [Vigna angularis]|uniref:Uncharacterized protein n=1 Tax=Phaseolus angularis TaxID=3914 RepID=A0A8T0KRM0_PHAAN|nr:uncharacterized protein HKW66_Vig0232870 [Vigna angularis]
MGVSAVSPSSRIRIDWAWQRHSLCPIAPEGPQSRLLHLRFVSVFGNDVEGYYEKLLCPYCCRRFFEFLLFEGFGSPDSDSSDSQSRSFDNDLVALVPNLWTEF